MLLTQAEKVPDFNPLPLLWDKGTAAEVLGDDFPLLLPHGKKHLRKKIRPLARRAVLPL